MAMPRKALSTLAILVLSSLAEATRHGYSLKKDIALRSGGDMAPGATALYRTLWQLLRIGLIEESDRRPEPQLDDERRRYFQITKTGRRELASEVARLERLLLATHPRRTATPRSRS